MNEIWIEVLKIGIPAVVSSGLVAYLFQKRLKRLGSYEKITNTIMERMLLGIEDVFRNVRHIHETIAEIESLVSQEPLNPALIKLKHGVLLRQHSAVKASIHAHRIYITALIPFGGSSKFLGDLNGIGMGAEILAEELNKEDEGKFLLIKKDLAEIISSWQTNYTQLCEKLQDIKKKILNGQPVL
jgi:hypothetical protein